MVLVGLLVPFADAPAKTGGAFRIEDRRAALGAPPAGTVWAGASKVDITPDRDHVYMAGFMVNRTSLGVHDPIYARCLYVDDGRTPLVMVSLDLLGFLLDRERNPGRPSRATWIDFGADLHFAFSDQGVVRGREMSLFTWLGSVLRANCYAYWDSQDRAPFWHQTRNLMTQIFKALF